MLPHTSYGLAPICSHILRVWLLACRLCRWYLVEVQSWGHVLEEQLKSSLSPFAYWPPGCEKSSSSTLTHHDALSFVHTKNLCKWPQSKPLNSWDKAFLFLRYFAHNRQLTDSFTVAIQTSPSDSFVICNLVATFNHMILWILSFLDLITASCSLKHNCQTCNIHLHVSISVLYDSGKFLQYIVAVLLEQSLRYIF